MSPDRATADRLSEHLDAVVRGDTTRSHDLDPTIGATVERFLAADDAPGPPPGLADQIWEQLMDQAASVELAPRIPGFPPDRNGRVLPPPRHIAPSNRGLSALAFLATAALIVLTLVGGIVASRGSLRILGPGQQTAIIPAIENTPDADPETILLQATFEQMPPGQTHRLGLNRIHLAPGAVQPVGSDADTGLGLHAFTVESGRVTVEADAPVALTRAGANLAAAPTSVAPGAVTVLDVGDQLFAPSDVSFRRRNDGSAPATLLEFSIGTVRDPITMVTPTAGVTYDLGVPYTFPSTLPSVPVEATVRRLTLAPGAELAVRDLPGLELVYVEAGALDLIYDDAEAAVTAERAFTIRAGSGTDTFGRSPERAVLVNRGGEPLVILTASLVPANAGEETPQEPWSDGWGSGDRLEE